MTKRIVKTTLINGCWEGYSTHCPYWYSVPNGDWYCQKSHKVIAMFPHPASNVAPYVGTIPEWCELEDS